MDKAGNAVYKLWKPHQENKEGKVELRDFIEKTKEMDDSVLITALSPDRHTGRPITGLEYKSGVLAFISSKSGSPITLRDIRRKVITENLSERTLLSCEQTKLDRNLDNLVRFISFDKLPDVRCLAINAKYDEDICAELTARAEAGVDEGWSDADIVQQAFDDGFTLEDFAEAGKSAYEWAKRVKEDHALIELTERLAS